MARHESTVLGAKPLGMRNSTADKPCDRCGRMLTRNHCRNRKDGLILCRECTSDKWFIEMAGKR